VQHYCPLALAAETLSLVPFAFQAALTVFLHHDAIAVCIVTIGMPSVIGYELALPGFNYTPRFRLVLGDVPQCRNTPYAVVASSSGRAS
jgi:hypothetical protein